MCSVYCSQVGDNHDAIVLLIESQPVANNGWELKWVVQDQRPKTCRKEQKKWGSQKSEQLKQMPRDVLQSMMMATLTALITKNVENAPQKSTSNNIHLPASYGDDRRGKVVEKSAALGPSVCKHPYICCTVQHWLSFMNLSHMSSHGRRFHFYLRKQRLEFFLVPLHSSCGFGGA